MDLNGEGRLWSVLLGSWVWSQRYSVLTGINGNLSGFLLGYWICKLRQAIIEEVKSVGVLFETVMYTMPIWWGRRRKVSPVRSMTMEIQTWRKRERDLGVAGLSSLLDSWMCVTVYRGCDWVVLRRSNFWRFRPSEMNAAKY